MKWIRVNDFIAHTHLTYFVVIIFVIEHSLHSKLRHFQRSHIVFRRSIGCACALYTFYSVAENEVAESVHLLKFVCKCKCCQSASNSRSLCYVNYVIKSHVWSWFQRFTHFKIASSTAHRIWYEYCLFSLIWKCKYARCCFLHCVYISMWWAHKTISPFIFLFLFWGGEGGSKINWHKINRLDSWCMW